MDEFIQQKRDAQGRPALQLAGAWVLAALADIEREIAGSVSAHGGAVLIDASAVTALDTAGALMLRRLLARTKGELVGLRQELAELMQLVQKADIECPEQPPQPSLLVAFLTRIGKGTVQVWQVMLELFSFIGEAFITMLGVLRHPRRLRMSSIVRHIDETGIDAIPIVALIAFLISVVLAYQGANQLKRFGAEIFTINMVAVSVLREMGVLLTAIMVAGRSGSAFTAEIGVMKVNEEVDAMRVIGLNPFEILVMPRLIALIITLPVLTFVADIMGLLGGGIMCYALLDITPRQYLEQLHTVIRINDFWVGMIKAPVFAFLIALVGCMRGMKVEGSAESVGRLTTVAVVHSIFLVLLADALFSILFTKIGL